MCVSVCVWNRSRNKVVAASAPLWSAPAFGTLCESLIVCLCLVLQESWSRHPCTLLNAFHGPALTSLWHWQNYCRADFSSLCPFWPFLYSFCFVFLSLCFKCILNVSFHISFSFLAFFFWCFKHILSSLSCQVSRLVNWLWYPYNLVSFSPPRLCFFGLCHPSHHGQPAERGQ